MTAAFDHLTPHEQNLMYEAIKDHSLAVIHRRYGVIVWSEEREVRTSTRYGGRIVKASVWWRYRRRFGVFP